MLPWIPALALVAAQQPAPDAEMRQDDRGRPAIGAYVDGRGPFAMVVDTAAQASFVAPALAVELGLAASEDGTSISGATGAAQVATYRAKRFASGLFDVADADLIGLPNAGSTSARGIVGMDLFLDLKLVFDRTGRRLRALPSGPPPAGFVVHQGRTLAGNFVVVPIVLDGIAVKAVVDSGAGRTIASPAVLKALGWRDDDPRLTTGGEIRGATQSSARVRLGTLGTVKLGPVTLRDVEMIFTGQDPIRGIGLNEEAVIVLGSDLLNLLPAYAVDFPRGTLEIRVPGRPIG